MTEEKYIRLVIQKHRVNISESNRMLLARRQINPYIVLWANKILGGIDQRFPPLANRKYLRKISIIGSFAKKTNIIEGTDIDVFISLGHIVPNTLREIYNSLADYLKVCGFQVRKQNVSVGINYNDISLDLVPGVKQKGPTNDHSLYCRKTKTWIKTNVQKHIILVRKSGRINEILVLKIWSKLHQLDFPSVYLELTLLEALKGCPRGRKLSYNLKKVFEY